MKENSLIAIEFVDDVEKFSHSKLKRKIELLRIYEEALKFNNEKEFEDLAFTAKYVLGLLRVVKSGTVNPDVQNIEQIKKDFSDNMKKSVDQIRKIIIFAGDDIKQHFESTYFELTQESFINMNELLADLEWAKMHLNEIKRR